MARIPGVESVSWASNMPLWARSVSGLQVEGHQPRSQADKISTIIDTVDTNYFETAGVALESGREFTNLDQENSTPVAIVNEKLAHDYWPRGNALGKRIQLAGRETDAADCRRSAKRQLYQLGGAAPTLRLCASGTELWWRDGLVCAQPREIRNRSCFPFNAKYMPPAPQIVISSPRTGREIIDGGLFGPRMGVALLSVFGLLALGLANIGLYGILAYSVNQRKREIGLRMALGAAQASVLRLILKQGMSLVMTGVLIGFAAALLVGRLVSRMLYGVSAGDPISVAGAAVVLLAVALLACYLPARWASRVDPLVALREG